jgi:hypothetical protein
MIDSGEDLVVVWSLILYHQNELQIDTSWVCEPYQLFSPAPEHELEPAPLPLARDLQLSVEPAAALASDSMGHHAY